MAKEYTADVVSRHQSRKGLYVIIHSKVYDVNPFLDEHQGGEDILLNVAGQGATEAFEDVGHSDEAREILEGF